MKAVKFIFGADLRGNHAMLQKQAKKAGSDVNQMDEGEALVFINRAQNKVKALTWNGVMSYARIDTKGGIDMNSLQEFARAFEPNGKFVYKSAIKQSILKRFGQKYGNKEFEVLQ